MHPDLSIGLKSAEFRIPTVGELAVDPKRVRGPQAVIVQLNRGSMDHPVIEVKGL
jgi:hypothetical protein